MKLNYTLQLLLLLVIFTVQGQNSTELDHLPKKVVFIIVDGIAADQLKTAHTPNLDKIARNGRFTEAYTGGRKKAYSETPTISAVGYNSLLTGTWANKHNVWGNGIHAPNYNYPSIFRLFKNTYPDGTIGVFSSWLENRTKLVGEGLQDTGNIKVDYHFDGLELDTLNYPHDPQRNFMKLIDYTVADHAASTILEKAPDLSWIYLEFSDDMGHGFGDSDRFRAAVHFEDQLVGKIWQAVKERQENFNEEWLFIVTTDHGRSQEDGKGHGRQTDRERSIWMVMNTPETNHYFKTEIPAMVDIAPTIASFLDIGVPRDIRYEWDGVSLIDPVDAIELQARKEGDKLILTWQNFSDGKGKIYLTGTNNFKSGGSDVYSLVKQVSLAAERAEISFSKLKDREKDYKIVLETPNTILNTWLINE